MKTVRQWLPDRFYMLENARGADVVFRGIWDIECESEALAKQLINSRIEAWQSWLAGLGFYSDWDKTQIENDSYTLHPKQIKRRQALQEVV